MRALIVIRLTVLVHALRAAFRRSRMLLSGRISRYGLAAID
jgi:hypothetical protein